LDPTSQKKKSWRKRKIYNQSREILNKTNKNYYILLSGDLNARIGNAEIHDIVKGLENLLQIPCSRWKFGKIRSIYTNKLLNTWVEEIKLKVQQKI
jgi:hypothetical protein